MGKKDKLAVNLAPKKFIGIAEKIVEGLLESGFMEEIVPEVSDPKGTVKISFRGNNYSKEGTEIKGRFTEAIAEAIKINLTYGNLGTLTLRNNSGQIVAKLYILPDGTLADDSWVRNEGWKH